VYIEQGDLTEALSILKKGKRSVEDNDKIVDMMDDITSGKYDSTEPSETEATSGESAPAVETLPPTPTITPTPEPTEAPQIDETAARSAYLYVLNDYEDQIRSFENGILYDQQVPSITYRDITGDGLPELIFEYSPEEYDGFAIYANIAIYTYDPLEDEAVCMKTFENAVVNAGGGFGTDIFIADNGNLIVFSDGGDEDWDTYVDEYSVSTFELTLMNAYHDEGRLDDSGTDYFYVDTYYLNDSEISEEEYDSAREAYVDSLTDVLMIDPVYYYDWMYEYNSEWLEMINSMPGEILFFDSAYDMLSN
ncbi:MAG: hypothetical protein IKT14_02280, partial [Clostridiales bacterium]|nr:hypothetical protein [Clostridiales bacterium]